MAAAWYSAARARKPGGGAGSSIRCSISPCGGEGVHVPGQRPVDERDEDALLHLLDRLVLDKVGADAPVLLGWVEHLVVDPSAVRRLQQRMVEEEEEAAAGLQHPRHLGDGRVDVTDVLEHEACDDGVERAGRRTGGRRAPPGRRRPHRPARVASATWAQVGSMPTAIAAPPARASRAIWPSPHPTSRTRRAPARCVAASGQDLLLVLRVGALGEAVLPPPGVGLPQVVTGHRPQHGIAVGGRRYLLAVSSEPSEWAAPLPRDVAIGSAPWRQRCCSPSSPWSACATTCTTTSPRGRAPASACSRPTRTTCRASWS